MLFVLKKNLSYVYNRLNFSLWKLSTLLQKSVEILYNLSVHNKQLPLRVLQVHICAANCAHTGLGSSAPARPDRQEGTGGDRLKPYKLCCADMALSFPADFFWQEGTNTMGKKKGIFLGWSTIHDLQAGKRPENLVSPWTRKSCPSFTWVVPQGSIRLSRPQWKLKE